jgi:glycosyltransferase involved in cell wall biosynthesis
MTNAGLERFEYDLSRRARMTVVGSETDAALFHKRGIAAHYIPVVGPTLPPPNRERFSSGRFFLFGKANTAMRAARQHFRTVVWPALDHELRQDWHQVGDPPTKPSDDPSWMWLTERFHVHGFVDDLPALFQFGDASVMPYPIDASGHAKYSVVMGYGMVNIGYEPGFRSTPELVHGENCLAADTTEELVESLRQFRRDPELRRRLAEASRATYEKKFSFEAQLANFEKMLAVSVAPDRSHARIA